MMKNSIDWQSGYQQGIRDAADMTDKPVTTLRDEAERLAGGIVTPDYIGDGYEDCVDAIHAALLKARNDALEEAALHIEKGVKVAMNKSGMTYRKTYADAIRSLKEQQHG